MLLFKNKFILITALTTLITLDHAVPAQLSFKEAERYNNIKEKSQEDVPETSVNIKAIRSFRKSFPKVEGEKWSMGNDHYFVRFSIGEIKHNIVYTKKGNLDYSLKRYTERQLIRSIRNMVKSMYYDHTIHTVSELYIHRKTIYIIRLSDSSGWLLLRVCDGEIEEIERLRKK